MTTQYREVSRKANVGERIRIVNPMHAYSYGKNDEGTVTSVTPPGVVAVIDGASDDSGIWHEEYVVLEPVDSAATFPEILTQFLRENADAVRKFLDEIEQPAQPKPLTRAEVIAKAKADVAELTEKMRSAPVGIGGNLTFRNRNTRPEFHVNRTKRAVTVLVRGVCSGSIYEKSTAKCAPGDVFHAEIGKAIALRKALGLPVPDEYVNAPKPDEPRVGAVVFGHTLRGEPHGIMTIERMRPELDGEKFGNFAANFVGKLGFLADKQYEIIDDTDVDYSAVGAEGSAA